MLFLLVPAIIKLWFMNFSVLASIFRCSHLSQQMSEVFLKTWVFLKAPDHNVVIEDVLHALGMFSQCRLNTRTGCFCDCCQVCKQLIQMGKFSLFVCDNLVINGERVQIHVVLQLCMR